MIPPLTDQVEQLRHVTSPAAWILARRRFRNDGTRTALAKDRAARRLSWRNRISDSAACLMGPLLPAFLGSFVGLLPVRPGQQHPALAIAVVRLLASGVAVVFAGEAQAFVTPGTPGFPMTEQRHVYPLSKALRMGPMRNTIEPPSAEPVLDLDQLGRDVAEERAGDRRFQTPTCQRQAERDERL